MSAHLRIGGLSFSLTLLLSLSLICIFLVNTYILHKSSCVLLCVSFYVFDICVPQVRKWQEAKMGVAKKALCRFLIDRGHTYYVDVQQKKIFSDENRKAKVIEKPKSKAKSIF